MSDMSAIDAAWLRMDRPTNLTIITSVMWLARPPDWDAVEELLRERLIDRFPRFSQRAVEPRIPIGTPRWQDDPRFALRRHVHRSQVARPRRPGRARGVRGNPPVHTTRSRQAAVERAPRRRLRRRRRDRLADPALHHRWDIARARVQSLGDHAPEAGIAPDVQEPAPPLAAVAGPAAPAMLASRRLATAIAREARDTVTDPRGILRGRIAGVDARALARIARTGSDTPTVLKGPLSVPQRTSWTTPISLDEVKRIGRPTGATVNDVALAALAGALRDHLAARGSLVEEIRAYLPFNLRSLDEPIPRELGNMFGLVFLTLPIGVADRGERLACVQQRMSDIKRSGEARIVFDGLSVIGIWPTRNARLWTDFFSAKATVVVSNIVGATKPIHLAGVTVKRMLIMAPRSGSVGLGVTIFSYNGRVTFGVNAAAALLPDPSELLGAMVTELRALRRLQAQPSRA